MQPGPRFAGPFIWEIARWFFGVVGESAGFRHDAGKRAQLANKLALTTLRSYGLPPNAATNAPRAPRSIRTAWPATDTLYVPTDGGAHSGLKLNRTSITLDPEWT